jgi:protein O-mannosyl-transferase
VRIDEKTAVQVGVTVGIVTLLVYLGALSCSFINLDDPFYITNNPLIRSLDIDALRRIFTEAHLGAWLPLTYVSLAVDYHFWGDNPTGYHLTNILLHAGNAALVVLLADRLLKNGRGLRVEGREVSVEGREVSVEGRGMRTQMAGLKDGGYLYPGMLLLAGLLWALHPLRVESVAWAAERKDVLNGLFTLAAILAYIGFVRLKNSGMERRKWLGTYLLSLFLFTLSLLAKQVSVTIPVILLLLDWYPLGRLGKGRLVPLLVEKIPFFAVALLIALVTIYFAVAEKMLSSIQDLPFYVRVLVSGNAIFEYCRLMLFPVGISPYFVLPKPLQYGYLVKTVVVVAVTLFMARFAARRQAAAATWFVFLILLLPMLAFVQAGDDLALAARYTYLPAIAPAIAVAAALVLFTGRLLSQGRRFLATVLLGTVAVFLAVSVGITLKLISVWKDTGSFWSRVIEIEPVGRAYGDRGVYYLINGKSAAAVDDFNAAIDIAAKAGVRSIFNLYAFRGVALSDTGRFSEAVADFDRAIALYPHPTYYQQRGAALKALGREAEAEDDFRRAGPNPPPIDWFE